MKVKMFLLFLVLAAIVFLLGFDLGYNQALEDIRDVVDIEPSNTSLKI